MKRIQKNEAWLTSKISEVEGKISVLDLLLKEKQISIKEKKKDWRGVNSH